MSLFYFIILVPETYSFHNPFEPIRRDQQIKLETFLEKVPKTILNISEDFSSYSNQPINQSENSRHSSQKNLSEINFSERDIQHKEWKEWFEKIPHYTINEIKRENNKRRILEIIKFFIQKLKKKSGILCSEAESKYFFSIVNSSKKL